MKHLAAMLLVSATMVADAQVPVRAPVNVATELYKGCLNATLMTAEIEPTRVGIIEFVEAADDRCLTWTVIWYPALMGPRIQDLQPSVVQRINSNRLRILQDLTNELRQQALR